MNPESMRTTGSYTSYDEVTVTENDTESEADEDENDDDDEGEEILVEEEDEADGDVSMEEMLQAKDARIRALERANKMKDEQLLHLQEEINALNARHKDGIYWLQVELDSARREKDATEEQMAELMGDLQGMTALPKSPESAEVLKDATIQNYIQAMASMEHQMSMIKTSAGEVVKTLKEEIADLMEDRGRMELDLLNQLAQLDSQMSLKGAEYERDLRSKDEVIQRLMTNRAVSTTADLEEYEAEIARLMEAKKIAESKLSKEREQSDEEVQRLELENSKLEHKLAQAEEDLAHYRSEGNTEGTMHALEHIANERQHIISILEQVAVVWEKADGAIRTLEDSMDKLRPDDDIAVKGDRERLLSTLETASLVHGQIKVSLLLIELKLRNQLQSLKNDKLSMGWAAPNDNKVIESMEAIQVDVMKVLGQVEDTLSRQIREMQEKTLEETKLMKEAILKRSKTLESMQLEHKVLEEEIERIKSTSGKSEAKSHSNGAVLNGVSKSVVDSLHFEVLRVIERVREKNELIQALRLEVESHKVTEEKLKKELKRLVRKSTPTKSTNGKERSTTTSPRQSPKKKTANVPSVTPSSPPRSPTRSSKKPTNGNVYNSPQPSPAVTLGIASAHTSASQMLKLKPSPREISKGKVTALMSPALGLSASASSD